MCYERWMRREKRHEERFDVELRHLLDEKRAHHEPPQPVIKREHEDSRRPKRERVKAGTSS
jgi:hypothetical protein